MGKSEQEKEVLKKLGQRIREIRIFKKISQMTLAALCDTEKTNLSRLENGKSNPTVITLKKIADKLSVHIVELFSSTNL
jgi:transcriptional regulator with XRE-family HTH domain